MALNLALVSTITAKTNALINPTTFGTALIAAPTAEQIIKINSLYVANTSAGTLTADVYVLNTSATWYIVQSLSIATAITTIVITKDAPIYLLGTTDSLFAKGSATGLTFTVSYELLA